MKALSFPGHFTEEMFKEERKHVARDSIWKPYPRCKPDLPGNYVVISPLYSDPVLAWWTGSRRSERWQGELVVRRWTTLKKFLETS